MPHTVDKFSSLRVFMKWINRYFPTLFLLSLGFIKVFDFPIFRHRIQLPELLFLLATPFVLWKVIWKLSLRYDSVIMFLVLLLVLQVSFVKFDSRHLEILGLIYLFLLSLLFRSFSSDKSVNQLSMSLLGLVVAGMGIVGWVIDFFGIDNILSWPRTTYYPYLGYVGRAMGLTGHPNMMMSLLAFCGFFLSTNYLLARDNRWTSKFVLIIIFVGAILTFSKAIVLLCICLLWIWMKVKKIVGVKRWFVSAFMFGLFGFYLFVTHIMIIRPKQVDWTALQSRAYTLDHTFYEDGNVGLVWTNYAVNKRTAFNAFLDHPFWGIGPGQYGEFVRRLKEENRYPTYFPNYDPHCNLLGFLAETGIFTTLLLLLLFWILNQEWKSYTTQTREGEAFKIAFAALFIFFLLEGINTDNLHFRHYWVALGLFLAQKNLHRTQVSDASTV